MIRTTLLAFATLFLFCGTSSADFIIDDFSTLDVVGGGPTGLGPGITVEVSDNVPPGAVGGIIQGPSRYEFVAPTIGDSFRVRYDWAGAFRDLGGAGDLFLTQLPAAFFGDWTVSIDQGVGAPLVFNPTNSSIPSILPSPIALGDATELTFDFTYDGNSPFPVAGQAFWGGGSSPLFATPEPTGLLMMGCAGLVVLSRRRRK